MSNILYDDVVKTRALLERLYRIKDDPRVISILKGCMHLDPASEVHLLSLVDRPELVYGEIRRLKATDADARETLNWLVRSYCQQMCVDRRGGRGTEFLIAEKNGGDRFCIHSDWGLSATALWDACRNSLPDVTEGLRR